MELFDGFSMMWPLDSDHCRLLSIFKVDPHLEYVPKFMLNFGMRFFLPKFVDYQLKAMKEKPEFVVKSMNEEQDLYDQIKKFGDVYVLNN
mmetsp:Transcript_23894/g.18246  ORF Transcript_23894/g.18246 Transcript_23894/m.18246 type:complete len:90 (+) Transcript_23894:215-484(+)